MGGINPFASEKVLGTPAVGTEIVRLPVHEAGEIDTPEAPVKAANAVPKDWLNRTFFIGANIAGLVICTVNHNGWFDTATVGCNDVVMVGVTVRFNSDAMTEMTTLPSSSSGGVCAAAANGNNETKTTSSALASDEFLVCIRSLLFLDAKLIWVRILLCARLACVSIN